MMVIKNLVCERVKTAGETSYSFIASNDKIDRMGDVINQSGWSLNAYKRNPVILFNHDSRSLPIGKGSAEIIDGQLMIDIEFDENDELAKKIKSKVEGGFLNAVSVGFKPIRAVERNTLNQEDKYYGEYGTYFEKAELLEVSVVTIPANSNATAAKFIDSVGDMDLFAKMVSKHIISIIEENDEYKITFAKAKEKQEEPEEEEVEQLEEQVEQPVEQGYDDDDKDDKEKQLNLELIRALLA
jgi:HK97 family phage prohead protease